ncbi:AAA family ATPase [Candidatus Poribacteria bacterium]|nr:AAA family ATPase [Candidatus Poribacteria bacterium]
MLQSLELENFKAFGERAHVPFAPITLIFGENSAGKSTILQILYLLKQTLESRETGALLLPRTENGIVDLGGFQEMLFDHDLKRTLSVRVETKLNRQLAIKFSFRRPSLEEEILLDQIELYHGNPSMCIAKFQPSDASEDLDELSNRMVFLLDSFFLDPSLGGSRGIMPSKVSAVKCVWLTKEPEYWKPEFEWCKERQGKILNGLKERLDDKTHSEEEFRGDNSKLQEELNALKDDIDFFQSDIDLETYISRRRKEEMSIVLGMQGLLPVGVISGERKPWLTGPGWLLLQQSDDRPFEIVQLAMAIGHALEQTLGALFPMAPFRRPPERWYIFTGTSPQDVGYRGNLLPDLLFRHHELVEETNEWLKKLDMGYEIEVKPVGGNSGDLFEMRLIDTRRKERVNVALPDVGFGVSQLLPFIVQSLVAKEQIISIEQPEVHVHPKLQADLGDLLAEAIKEPRQNRFIVETHSEHLILRLQRLIRKKLLEPEDVSVIYVSRGPEGAKAERLHLDEDGDFIDEWPNGFFLERLREL